MKKLLLVLAASLLSSTPAKATGGLLCSTAGGSNVSLALVVSHTAVPAIVSARLTDGGLEVPVTVAQSWLDPAELRVDLVDPDAMRHEVRIRVTRQGDHYDGSLWRHGKRRWVRCRES